MRDALLECNLTVEKWLRGKRIDTLLRRHLPNYTREAIHGLIARGAVHLGDRPAVLEDRVRQGQQVRVRLDVPPDNAPPAEAMPLEVLFEDAWLLVVNKPAGQVMHPCKAHLQGTLFSAVQAHLDAQTAWPGLARPGLVHRLDRETSGVVVVAKDARAHHYLAHQFQRRQVRKSYLALVEGTPSPPSAEITRPMSRHPYETAKMTALAEDARCGGGKQGVQSAHTTYELIERLGRFSLLNVQPRTGRLHQLRVHLAALGHPVVADALYGNRAELRVADVGQAEATDEVLICRQALHAQRIALRHPCTGAALEISAPLPDDLQSTLCVLRQACGAQEEVTCPR